MPPFDTWQRCCPIPTGTGPLGRIQAHLARSGVRAELARCEMAEEFPAVVVEEVKRLGLPLLFADAPGEPWTTAYHLNTLNAIAAQESGSLAISLGITGLALLPLYMAGTPEQLARVAARLLTGAQAAMLLSESPRGSDLSAIDARAERGRRDARGFAPEGGGQAVDCYRVTGEKQLINLVDRAELLMTLARTSERTSGLGGAGGLSLFLIERDATVERLPRWRTLPAPAAEIGGVRFRGTRVPTDARIGEEGEGFRLVQGALTVSRGGISAFASGTASRACGLAFTYARERILYGQPIARLAAVADHLARMAALDLATSCLSLAAAAAVNALGQRAAYLTAVAKLVACDLAERVVTEGRAVVSARALLAELPYQQVVRDAMLYGVFDGTRHLMLDHIQWRVHQMCRTSPGVAGEEDRAAVYRAPPVSLVDSSRRRGPAWLPRPAASAERLAALPGAVDLGPLREGAAALEAASASLPADAWSEPPLAHAVAGSWARLEAALAAAALGDPVRRKALRLSPLPPGDPALDPADVARLAVALIAREALADARAALAGAGVTMNGAAETVLAVEQARAARAVRGAIQERS